MSSLLRPACILLLAAAAAPTLAKEKPRASSPPSSPPPVDQCLVGPDRLLPLSLKLDPKKGGWLEIDPGPPGGAPVFTWVKRPDGLPGEGGELGEWRGAKIVVSRESCFPPENAGQVSDITECMVYLLSPGGSLQPFFIIPPGMGNISTAEYRLADPATPDEPPHVTVEGSFTWVRSRPAERIYTADFALTPRGPRLRTFTTRDGLHGPGERTTYDEAGKIQRTQKLPAQPDPGDPATPADPTAPDQ